jgi:hypothetical protein
MSGALRGDWRGAGEHSIYVSSEYQLSHFLLTSCNVEFGLEYPGLNSSRMHISKKNYVAFGIGARKIGVPSPKEIMQ